MEEKNLLRTLLFTAFYFAYLSFSYADESLSPVFKVEGKVSVTDYKSKSSEWMLETTVLVNSGDYKGYLKSDGTFSVNGLPSGSYIVEVSSPNYQFERYRVDITKGGKIRARRLNFLQPNAVHVVPYPLKFVATKQASFFEIREQWKVTDFLFNPMILMMILPLLFVFVMPKMMSMADPEAQKEMQSQMNMFQHQKQVPDLSEFMSNFFSGNDGKKRKTASSVDKSVTKRAGKRR